MDTGNRNGYDSNQICTYGFYDPKIRATFIKGGNFDEINLCDVLEFDDNENVSNNLYKKELLQILNIEDINKFNKKYMQYIYELMHTENLYNKDILNLVKKYIQTKKLDDSINIFVLFSYDFFFFFHNYLTELINIGCPLDSTYLQLKYVIQYHIQKDEKDEKDEKENS